MPHLAALAKVVPVLQFVEAWGAISKGNASMSLRELRALGVVRHVDVPGDRRNFYVTEPDVWTMFFRILKERKRREFDPALDAIRGLLAKPGATGGGAARPRRTRASPGTRRDLRGTGRRKK